MSYFDFDSLETCNRKMFEALQLGRQLAPTHASLLISGEAGVGKTSLARYFFAKSRSPRLYVLECRNTAGFDFSLVQGGTLLIEDLDCASTNLQQQILDLYLRVDGSKPRFISTSRRDLRQLVKQEQFRQDLFYKLAVVQMEMPSIQNREEDFREISHFILDFTQIMHGRKNLSISDEAMARLKSWAWPGNIRELENVIERAVLLTKSSVIEPEMIQFESIVEEGHLDFAPGMSLSEVEKRLILQTLELTAQNRTRAAQLLGISIRTLRNKINEYREEGVL